MTEKKKSIFDKAIDALTDRDEKEAAAAEAAKKAEAERVIASKKAAAEKAAADKAAAAKAAADKAAAEKAAAVKAAADKAAAVKAATAKAATAKVAEQREAAREAFAAKIAAAKPKKGVVTIRSLRVRKDHGTDAAVVAGLVEGDEVTIYEEWTDGKDIWVRIGEDQWSGMLHDGNTYIKYVE